MWRARRRDERTGAGAGARTSSRPPRRRLTAALAAATILGTTTGTLAFAAGSASAADGRLTPGFGTNGIVVDPIAGAAGRTVLTFDLLDLPDGSILVSGALEKNNGDGEQGFIVKYRANGTRDTSFGIGGRAALPAGNTSEPLAMASLPDGRIVVAGRFFGDQIPANGGLYVLAADGTSLGLIGTYPATRDSTATNRLVAQPDGSVLAIGSDLRLVLPSGTLDTSVQRTLPSFEYRSRYPSAATGLADGRIAIMSTGELLVDGVSRRRCSVSLFDRTGALDTSFGSDGHVEIVVGANFPQSCWQVLAEPTGSMLVVVGDPKTSKTTMVRLAADGTVLAPPAPNLSVSAPTLGHEFDVEGNGRILVVRPGAEVTVEAFRADGSADPSFGGGDPVPLHTDTPRPTVHALQTGGIVVLSGESPESIVIGRLDSNKGTAPQPTALGTTRLVPIAPVRFLDTRDGLGAPAAPIGAGRQVDLQISGAHGVPNDARAVVMSVAATQTAGPGFVTAWPTGTTRPNVASLNIERAGQTVANLVTVKLGATGAVSLYSLGQTDLVADVQGYYVASDAVADGRFVPAVPPTRLVDSRTGLGAPGALAAGSEVEVQIAGAGPVPATGIEAVALNIAATDVPAPGYVTVYPTGTVRPFVSSLNVDAGETRSNMVIVPIGAGGRISIYSFGGAQIIVDVAGWFTDSTAPTSNSGLYVPITPARIVDTRLSSAAPLAPDTIISRLVGGSQVAPPRGRTSAIVVNLTATETVAPGYFSLWPHGLVRPTVANLNAGAAGQTVPNAAIVPLRQEMIDGYTQSGAHLVIDLFGYYLS